MSMDWVAQSLGLCIGAYAVVSVITRIVSDIVKRDIYVYKLIAVITFCVVLRRFCHLFSFLPPSLELPRTKALGSISNPMDIPRYKRGPLASLRQAPRGLRANAAHSTG